MGGSGSKIFIKVGTEMVKAAVKALTEGEGAPNDQASVRSFVSTVLQIPDATTEEELERAIEDIDPNDDISTEAERFIRAAAIYVYRQRDGEGKDSDFWLACRECLVKLGFGDTLQIYCATPASDDVLNGFCAGLKGCKFHKQVVSAGLEFKLWLITKDALNMLETYLEAQSKEVVSKSKTM